MAVLAHEQHAVVVVERDHPDRAGVHDEVAVDRAGGAEIDGLRTTSHTAPWNTSSTASTGRVDGLVGEEAADGPARPAHAGSETARVVHRQLGGLGLTVHGG